jgi:Retrotransposon gag protein
MSGRKERFAGMPEAERQELLNLEKSGEVVDDLMEDVNDQPEQPDQVNPNPEVNVTPPSKEGTKKGNKGKLVQQLLDRIVALEGHLMKKRAPKTQVRVPTPPLFTGKRGSFQFCASKVESYAQISGLEEDKWVALAVQCLDEKPSKIWDSCLKRKLRENPHAVVTWQDFKSIMAKRYDSTDLVSLSRQKLDHVFQGNEGVERYTERFVALLSDVETEYEIFLVST